MQNHNEADARFDELEVALESLSPRSSGIDRDRLMFHAGRQTALRTAPRRERRWLWPAATAVSTVAAVLIAALFLTRRPQVIHEVQYLEKPVPAPPVVRVAEPDRRHRTSQVAAGRIRSDTGRLGNREFQQRFPALALAVDALPPSQSFADAARPAASYFELRERFHRRARLHPLLSEIGDFDNTSPTTPGDSL